MSRKNTSSVDTTEGDKIVRRSREFKNSIPVSFDHKKADEQIINARKGANVALAKAKKKKKAKMKKASQKKNKK